MTTPALGIIHLVRALNIRSVLDVGANVGQFGQSLLDQGYDGELMSFEPIHQNFIELSRASANHPNWHCMQLALGAEDGEVDINVSANSVSSSVLPALPWSIKEHGPIAPVRQEALTIRRLDTLWNELPFLYSSGQLMLKIDAQGFEPHVIAGLGERLDDVALLLLEASLIPVYEGETPFEVLVSDMRRCGMHPVWIGAGWGSATTGQIFQCDIAFAKHPLVQISS